MKKLISILLVLLLTLSLVACSQQPAQSSTPGAEASDADAPAAEDAAVGEEQPEIVREYPDREPLHFWFWGASTSQQEHFKKVLCDWYNESQDKYELILEFRGSVDADIPVALAAGQGPDIVYASGPSYTATYAQAGLVLDLTPYAEQYGWKDRLLGVMYDSCTLDGKLYSLPGGLLVGGLFYNTEIFAEQGWSVPTTMDELITTMDAAKAAGYYPLGAGNKGWKPCNDHFSSMIMGSYLPASYIYKALTGEISFADPAIVDAVQKTADWYQAGYLAGEDYVNLDSSEVMQTLTNKKSAMVSAPSLYFQWIDTAFEDSIGFTVMPNTYSDHNVYNVSMTSNYAINANSKAPDECAKILDYMMTGEFVLAMNEAWPAYWNLPIKELPTMDGSSLSGLAKTCFDAVQTAIPEIDAGYFYYHPATFYPAATMTAFQDIDTVWQGVMTAEQFCQTVAMELESDISNNLVPPLAVPAA